MDALKKKRDFAYATILENNQGEEYFFKEKQLGNVIRELLAQEIARIMKLDYVVYSKHVFDGKEGLISKTFVESGLN